LLIAAIFATAAGACRRFDYDGIVDDSK